MMAPRKGTSWRSRYLIVAGILIGVGSFFQEETLPFWLSLIGGIGMFAAGILVAREERRRNRTE
jgi:hypothetical protein